MGNIHGNVADRLSGLVYGRPLTKLFCISGYSLMGHRPLHKTVVNGCSLWVESRTWQCVRGAAAYDTMSDMIRQLKVQARIEVLRR